MVNLQHAHRPDSTDIDVYQFDLDSRGKLTVDSIAERAGTGLDSTLRIYRDRGRDATLIAQNDDYFGSDAFLDLELGSGALLRNGCCCRTRLRPPMMGTVLAALRRATTNYGSASNRL